MDIKDSKNGNIIDVTQVRNTASVNGKESKFNACDDSLCPESKIVEGEKCDLLKGVDERDDTPIQSDAESAKLADAVLQENIEGKVFNVFNVIIYWDIVR